MRTTEAMNGMSLNEDEAQQQAQNTEEPTSQRITINYEKFNQIKLMLGHRLRLNQQEPEEESK